MNYQQLLAGALLSLADGDKAATLAGLDAALAEAGRVDPDGPRVAEVLSYMAQVHSQWGHAAEAEAAKTRFLAIQARFHDLT